MEEQGLPLSINLHLVVDGVEVTDLLFDSGQLCAVRLSAGHASQRFTPRKQGSEGDDSDCTMIFEGEVQGLTGDQKKKEQHQVGDGSHCQLFCMAGTPRQAFLYGSHSKTDFLGMARTPRPATTSIPQLVRHLKKDLSRKTYLSLNLICSQSSASWSIVGLPPTASQAVHRRRTVDKASISLVVPFSL